MVLYTNKKGGDFNMTRYNKKLYTSLVDIRKEIQSQIMMIEQRKQQAIKEAQSIDECEFICLSSQADKENLLHYLESDNTYTYIKIGK